MTEKTKHKYKPGTGFIYFGIIIVAWPLFISVANGGVITAFMFVMLLAGAACIIIGAVKKSNLKKG